MKKIVNIRSRFARSTLIVAAFVFCTCNQTSAATLYSEDFVTGVATSLDDRVIGWSAFDANSTNLSASTKDPMHVSGDGRVLIASGRNANGSAYALISDAPKIDPGQYTDALAVNFIQSANDRSVDDSATMGWRVIVEVDGIWNATDLLSFTRGGSNVSVTVADKIWRAWETDLTDGFAFEDSNFGSASTLPTGNITRFGILAVDGASGENDSLVLYDYTITGSAQIN